MRVVKNRTGLLICVAVVVLALCGGGYYAWHIPAVQDHLLESADLNSLADRVNSNPTDWRAQYWYGRRSAETGDLTSAERALRIALGSNPDYLPAITQLGKVLLAENRVEEGFQLLRMAAGRDPKEVEARITLALMYRGQGAAHRGIDMAQEVLKQDSDNVRALYELGACQAYLRQFAPAEETLRRSLRKAPNDYPTLVLLSRVLLQEGNVTEAEATARQAVQQLPADLDGLVALAEVLAKKPPVAVHREEALQLLTKARTLGGTRIEVLMLIAQLQAAAGRWQEALLALLDVIRVDPRKTSAYFLMARAYRELGRPAESKRAEADFHKLEAYDQQVQSLRDMIGANPESSTLRFKLAQVYVDAGQADLAITLYRSGLQRDPENTRARKALTDLIRKAASQ